MLDSTPELDEECEPVPMRENIPRDVVCVIELQAPHDPHEWVDFPGATYVEYDGERGVLPGIRLLPTPGHTPRIRAATPRDQEDT